MRCVVEMGGLYEVRGGDGRPLCGARRRWEAFMRCVVEMGGLNEVRGRDGRPV